MATFVGVNNGDGTATLQVRGAVVNCTQVRIGFGTFAYNNVALDFLDNGAAPGINSYTVTFLTSSGASIGSLSTSVNVTWPTGTVTAHSSGPSIGCSWSIPDDNNTYYTFAGATLYYSINGGSLQQYGASLAYGLSGDVGFPVFAGYSTPFEWEVVPQWSFSGHPNAVRFPIGSSTTSAAPPAAPNPPTNLRVTADIGTSISLAWDAPVGGASGYEISRSINGAAYTVLGTQTGTTKTDSSPGGVRPIAYRVRAYNGNSGGTAYSGYVTVGSGATDSCGVLVG